MQQQPYSGVENLEVMREARNYNRYLLRTVQAHATPRARILDFGAGSGQFALPLAELGFNLTALEPDDFLRGRLVQGGVRAIADLAALDYEALDYIYTLNVLEHISDDAAALRQMHAKLRSGGTLLIYVPAFPVIYSSMDAKVGHIRRYTRKTLTDVVCAAGFHVKKVSYVDSLGFVASLLFKALGSKGGGVNPLTLKLYDRAVFPISRLLDTILHRWVGKNLLMIARR